VKCIAALVTWLGAVRQEVAPRTSERYAEIVIGFLIPAIGNLHLSKLAPVHIQDAHNAWAAGATVRQAAFRRGSGATFTGSSAQPSPVPWNSRSSRAMRMTGSESGCRKSSPRDGDPLGRANARLLDAIRHTRVYWPALIALATGMRRGEILALRWRNIDFDRGNLRVLESLEQTKGGLRAKTPKSEKARAITLPAFAIEELRRLKREQAEELLKLGVR
jgi:integrase